MALLILVLCIFEFQMEMTVERWFFVDPLMDDFCVRFNEKFNIVLKNGCFILEVNMHRV